MSIEIITPTCTWRTMTIADIPAVQTILMDWEHGNRILSPSQIENDCYRWLNHIDNHTSEYPVRPNSDFTEVIVAYKDTNPFAYMRYTVRGGNHKLAPLPLSCLELVVFAVAPNYRGQGYQGTILNEMVASCFEHTKPAMVIAHAAGTKSRSRLDTFNDHEERRIINSRITGRQREKIVLARRNYMKRIADAPRFNLASQITFSHTPRQIRASRVER